MTMEETNYLKIHLLITKMRSFAPINCGQIEGFAAQDPPVVRIFDGHPGDDPRISEVR